MTRSLAYRLIRNNIRRLQDPDEIEDLIAQLAERLDQVKPGDLPDPTPRQSNTGKQAARGWVELKTINGCGPYAYQRWWEGKRCRSKYMAKSRLRSLMKNPAWRVGPFPH